MGAVTPPVWTVRFRAIIAVKVYFFNTDSALAGLTDERLPRDDGEHSHAE
jgi:hypothetical protein